MNSSTAWVIYRAPPGYAPGFIARRYLYAAGEIVEIDTPKVGDDLDELRARMPEGSMVVSRNACDAELVLETWL